MKKMLSMVLVIIILLSASAALAEGMGVQVIGGPAVETDPVSLDDFKLNIPVVIDGYGELTGTKYEVVDTLNYYTTASAGWTDRYKSGNEAEYILLSMDILNRQMKEVNFLDQYNVKVVFDESYEYAGWAYQLDFDKAETYAILDHEWFAIKPMYAGHYYFGCTLPNAIINSKAPLKMIITIGGNEITYNIRK